MRRLIVGTLALLWLPGCYNTVTINELSTLEDDEVIVYTKDGPHYHLKTWRVTENGDVIGKGYACSATTKKFQHVTENQSEFSGTIVASTIGEIKSSSSHLRVGLVPIFAVTAGLGIAFTVGYRMSR